MYVKFLVHFLSGIKVQLANISEDEQMRSNASVASILAFYCCHRDCDWNAKNQVINGKIDVVVAIEVVRNSKEIFYINKNNTANE